MTTEPGMWECGRCGEKFADRETAQRHADHCDRPTVRVMVADSESATPTQAVLDRIASEVRPKLGQDTFDGGYDCCGCSSYSKIVEDIEAIVREVLGDAAALTS